MDSKQLAQAKDYIVSGGKIDAITKKYNVSEKQLTELTTL